jgi:hypothetical protein
MRFYNIALILTLILIFNHSILAGNNQDKQLSLLNDSIYFYVLGDSIAYYSKPSEESEILGYLNWGDSILCNQVFLKKDGTLEVRPAHSANLKHWYPWMSIRVNDTDSTWISNFAVTRKFEFDSIGNFIVGYSYHSDEAGNSFVLSHFLKKIDDGLIKVVELDKTNPHEKGTWIEDKYYLYCTYDLYPDVYVRLIDIKSYQIKELGIGMMPVYSKNSNSVLILKDAQSNLKDKSNSTLYRINLGSNVTDTLFIDSSDSTRLCYGVEDYGECTDLKIDLHNDKEVYQFYLFNDKSAYHDDYFIEQIRIRVDEDGKLISREIIDL